MSDNPLRGLSLPESSRCTRLRKLSLQPGSRYRWRECIDVDGSASSEIEVAAVECGPAPQQAAEPARVTAGSRVGATATARAPIRKRERMRDDWGLRSLRRFRGFRVAAGLRAVAGVPLAHASVRPGAV